MSSLCSSSERSSRAHSLSSTSLSSSRSSSSFFYHVSNASSSNTEVSISSPGSPNPQTSSHKTKDFIAAASAKLSKAREQVSHALSDATIPKESKFRSSITSAIVEEDVGYYGSDGDIRGANMKSASLQKARPNITTNAGAPNTNTTSRKRLLAHPDVLSNTRAIPDFELTTKTLLKPPAGLGLALPSVHLSKPIARACTMPSIKSSSEHNLRDSPSSNSPPPTSHPHGPPKVYLRPIELPGTPSPMELLPPSIIMCESMHRSLCKGFKQSLSALPSPAEGLSPLWTLPPLTGFVASHTTPQSPVLLGEGGLKLISHPIGGGDWNPYFPSI
ncbi:uncharacterized protein EDB91DRAFT_1291170 [Suillus paluster]|uniref:uncharacterized protein n=1 Tax=Suillus paluster TaxID=48578 RepID=UPI001B87619F|nr:uncharacterized protein EDB91DRAFT_1291170 [Suillus paluster]KAG1737149.1 hypothetical protein EDB91DRAFT_1291170 [Suillus paluster]